MVKGYKALNEDTTNRYGMSFTPGCTYKTPDEIKFGVNGNGFHICTSLCDVFRYVNANQKNVIVAEVTGSGKMAHFDDYYYGYFDMYACEEITVERFLTRKEIIDSMLEASSFEAQKFLWTCRLSDEEKVLFWEQFRSELTVIRALLYSQYGIKDVYKKNMDIDSIRMVMRYGQNNN